MVSCNRVIIVLLSVYLIYLLFLKTKKNNETFADIPTTTNLQYVAFTSDIGDIQSVNKNAVFTSGMIMMWSGSLTSLPVGWALCDGRNNTPDLRGRFVLGSTYGQSMTDSNDRGGVNLTTGDKGGERDHKLTEEEMPSHTHANMGNTWYYGDQGRAQNGGLRQGEWGSWTANESFFTGGDKPHNNMPPYYVLAFIMKL